MCEEKLQFKFKKGLYNQALDVHVHVHVCYNTLTQSKDQHEQMTKIIFGKKHLRIKLVKQILHRLQPQIFIFIYTALYLSINGKMNPINIDKKSF